MDTLIIQILQIDCHEKFHSSSKGVSTTLFLSFKMPLIVCLSPFFSIVNESMEISISVLPMDKILIQPCITSPP